MPREGSRTLSDLRSPVLRIACDRCGRSGRYNAARLWRERGDLKLTDFLGGRPIARGERVPRSTIDATHDLSFDESYPLSTASGRLSRARQEGLAPLPHAAPRPFEDLCGALSRLAHRPHLLKRPTKCFLGFDFRRDVRHDQPRLRRLNRNSAA